MALANWIKSFEYMAEKSYMLCAAFDLQLNQLNLPLRTFWSVTPDISLYKARRILSENGGISHVTPSRFRIQNTTHLCTLTIVRQV